MNNNPQLNNDFPAGFLIKDKSGKFKKVNEDKVDDYKITDQINKNNLSISNKIQPQLSNQIIEEKSKPDTSTTKVSSNILEKKITPIANSAISQPISTPPLAPTRANFIADPDDEEEIRNHQTELDKILAETTTKPIKKIDIGFIIEGIINKLNLKFEAEVYKKRFIKIVESRINDIRSSIEIEEVLRRAKKIGGLEFTEEIAKKIVKELDNSLKDLPQPKEIHQEINNIPPIPKKEEIKKQPMFSAAPPAFVPIPSVSSTIVTKPNKTKQQLFRKDNIKSEVTSDKSAETKIQVEQKNSKQLLEETKQRTLKKQTVNKLYAKTSAESMAKISKSRQTESDRPQVIDIRQPDITLGPVEEIGEINIKEFRRMGDNPASSAEKVLEKFYLLEDNSWEERMNGLLAWQKSPIYKLYVQIGRESLKNNVSVEQIISKRAATKNTNLHFEEFLAINSLNNKLAI